jgi:hypothetical protein
MRPRLETIGLALAGRAGARLAQRLGLPPSRSTLLRLLRALPDPEVERVAWLGVDDFALRRGHVYGTVLVDMATHHPVDLAAVVNGLTLTTALPSRPMREGPGRGEGDTLSIGVLSARSAKEDR